MNQDPSQPDPVADTQPAPDPQPSAEPTTTPPKRPTTITILVGVAVVLLAAILIINLNNRSPKLDSKTEALVRKRVERDALRAAIDAERTRLGLPPVTGVGAGEDPATIADRIGSDSATLAGMLTRFDDLLRERDTQIADKNNALLASERQRQALSDTITRLQQQLDKALVDGSNSDLLRRQLDAQTSRSAELERQLNEARASLTNMADRPDSDELDRLRKQLEETRRARDFYDERNRQLEAELASLRGAAASQVDLFADDESELLPAAVALYASLKQLEKKPDSEIMAAYSRYGNELGASVLRKLSFPTGSSDLTADDLAAVEALAPSLPDQGLIFVVGYASETGNVDNNRELSSARATKTAEAINANKLGNQRVQAAYLGQTTRFASDIPERNQITEIWHILPPPGANPLPDALQR